MPRELRWWHIRKNRDHKVRRRPEKILKRRKIFDPRAEQSWERRKKPAKERLDVTSLWAVAVGQTAQGCEVEKGLKYTKIAKLKACMIHS